MFLIDSEAALSSNVFFFQLIPSSLFSVYLFLFSYKINFHTSVFYASTLLKLLKWFLLLISDNTEHNFEKHLLFIPLFKWMRSAKRSGISNIFFCSKIFEKFIRVISFYYLSMYKFKSIISSFIFKFKKKI